MNITREVSMKIAAPAGCIAFLWLALSSDRVSAQSGGEIQVTGGVSTASFTTPQGKIQVHVSSDAAPGDTISGVVLAEPTGQTPQEQQANLGTLTGLRRGVGRPADEGGDASIRMDRARRSSHGSRDTHAAQPRRAASSRKCQCRSIPSHHSRAALVRPTSTLPTDIQIGRPATIRGRLDGRLRGKTVDVGGGDGRSPGLLAPTDRLSRDARQPSAKCRFASLTTARMTEGMIRAMGVRLSATSTQLLKGQRATLTTTVVGLGGITEPATWRSETSLAAVVQLEGGAPRIAIQPRDVRADGTYVHTRRLTGVQAGGYQILASVSRPPLSRFDLAGTIGNVVECLGGSGPFQNRARRSRPDPAFGSRRAAAPRGLPQAAGAEWRGCCRASSSRCSRITATTCATTSCRRIAQRRTDAASAGDAGRAATAAGGNAGGRLHPGAAMDVFTVPFRPRGSGIVPVDRLSVRDLFA